MKILTLDGDELRACAKIPVRRHELSLSTVFMSPSLAVFAPDGTNVTHRIFPKRIDVWPTAENIADAITWVNRQ